LEAVKISGYTATIFEELYVLPAPVTTNTFTTITQVNAKAATAIPRCIIPAGAFSAIGKSHYFRARGTVQSAAGTATFIFTGGLDVAGGTLLKTMFATPALTLPTGTAVFDIEGDLTAQAVGQAGSTIQCNGSMRVGGSTANAWETGLAATTTTTVGAQMLFSNSITTLDNEAPQFLDLFCTCSASSATNQIILQQLKLYGEN